MPLFGTPMLSISWSSSGGGIIAADLGLDRIAQLRGLLESHAAAGAQVQSHLTGVDRGEEVPPKPGQQQKRRSADRHERQR